jgi:hypothetical protein
MAERPARGRRLRALEPRRLVVLSGLSVGRPEQRRDGDAARGSLLQRGEGRPDPVVERSFDVA